MAILKSLTAKSILLQSTKGLECLHQQNIVLGYLKPSNFLIKEIRTANGSHRYTVKITFADFLLGKLRVKIRKLTRSEEPFWKRRKRVWGLKGWISPEMKNMEHKLAPSSNVFTLGCFYHYVLTGMATPDGKPIHPFGGSFSEEERTHHIYNPDHAVYSIDWNPAKNPDGVTGIDGNAVILIKRMIQFDETKRPTLSEVLNDTYYTQNDWLDLLFKVLLKHDTSQVFKYYNFICGTFYIPGAYKFYFIYVALHTRSRVLRLIYGRLCSMFICKHEKNKRQ